MALASLLLVFHSLWLGAHAQASVECLKGTCEEDWNTDETNLAQLRSVRTKEGTGPSCAELMKSGSCTTIGSMGTCFSGTVCAGDITETNQNTAVKCCKAAASSGMGGVGGFDMGDMFGGNMFGGSTRAEAPTAPAAPTIAPPSAAGTFDMPDWFFQPPPVSHHRFDPPLTLHIPGSPAASAAAAHSKEPPATLCPDAPSNLGDVFNGELKKRGGCGAADCGCPASKGRLEGAGCAVCQ